MKPIVRPDQIVGILRTIGLQLPAEMGISLETYISDLEAKQQAALPANSHASAWDAKNPPLWSHQHSVQREQHRRERALIKQSYSR